jgi:hypothetical protein
MPRSVIEPYCPRKVTIEWGLGRRWRGPYVAQARLSYEPSRALGKGPDRQSAESVTSSASAAPMVGSPSTTAICGLRIGCGQPKLRVQVGIFGALSNPEVRERLEHLAKKLDRLQNVGVARQPTILRRSLRVGAIPEAIMQVLADSVEPMRMRDIHAEVETLVGRSVSRSAVKNWLANHVRGEQALLIRLGRGRYRLRTQLA